MDNLENTCLDIEDETEEFEFDDLPFDFESLLVDKPDDEVICKLCYDLILKPVQLNPCEHTFCQECVQSNNFTFCPYCKRPTVSQKPNRLFKSTSIDKLMMRCRFNCGSVFPLEERERHEEECELVVVKCENKCDKEGLTRKMLKEHMEECTHRKQICNCGKEIVVRDLANHLTEECEAISECPYCKLQLKQKEMPQHNENCQKRKAEMIKAMFPMIPELQVIEESLSKVNGNLEIAIKEIRNNYNPIDTCIEVYNLTKNVRENHLQDLIMQICPAVKLNIDWSFSDGTWCWINLRSEEGAQLLQSTLQARGFPFVRSPLKENTLWFGRTDHMTFCPPLNTVDCPVHEFPTVNCPFKHNVSKNGECIRWKAGQLCEKPTVCKFAHPGKTVVDLKFTKRVPNICKFCQKGSHFGWECPERAFVNGTKGTVLNDTVGGVVSTLENILVSERGTMLANRAGIALRRANPATATVLQEQFGGKLKKLLEAYPNKFALINQEQPGLAMIQLITKPSNPNGPIGGGIPLTASALAAKTPRRVPLLSREWEIDTELLPFVHNTMQPHFEKIKNNIKTDKRLLPDLHVLVQQLHSFDRTSHVSALKSCMRAVGEAIANIQLCEYEPNFDQTISFLDFKEKIKKLQNYNPNLSKALHYVRKLANEDAKLSGNNQPLPEHDSLAEMFNRLTEALGIFFKSCTTEAVISQKPKLLASSIGSQNSNNSMSVEQYYQNSVASLSGQTYQNFPQTTVPTAIQNQYQNFLASNPASNSQNSYAFPTSLTPVQIFSGTVNAPQSNGHTYTNLSNVIQRPSTPNNYSSGFSSPYNMSNETNSMGQTLLSQRFSPSMFNSMDLNGIDKNSQFSNGNTQQTQFNNGFPSSLSFKPFFSGAGATNSLNLNSSLGPLVVAEKVCLNCGAINSHSSSQCRGCGWCGRTNHVVDQCTSKLPRCGYCSKQQNKGLGHQTCDCRYLLSSGKGI